MRILYDCSGRWKIYTCDADQCATTTWYTSLDETLETFCKHANIYEDILLLGEEGFSYFCFSVSLQTHTPFTVHDLKGIVQEKLSYIKAYHHQDSRYVHHEIAHGRVNGQPQKYLLGKTGHLQFDLQIYMLQPELSYALRAHQHQEYDPGKDQWKNGVTGQGQQVKRLQVYPRSYFTCQFLTYHLHKESYVLLVMYDEKTVLMRLEWGWWRAIEHVNRGLHHLKKIYREYGVEAFLYTSPAEHPFAKKTVGEANRAFISQLVKRMRQYLPEKTSVIAIGRILKNPAFLEVLQEIYGSQCQGFLLPFHYAQTLRIPYQRVWQPDEIHVASCLHYCLK